MIIIGEKLNGSIPSMAKAIAEKNEGHIKDLAKRQADAGASYIDVCASVAPAVELDTLHWMIDLVQSVTDTPIAVDSPDAKMIVNALKFCDKPGLVNSVSMEGDKIEVAFPAIAKSDWGVVALLCDDTGLSQSIEKKLSIFKSIMEKAKKYNIDPSRIHIDPLVQMLCISEDGILSITGAMRTIKEQYPTIHLTGGASNISYQLPSRKFVNYGFVILCMAAGMDSALIDPLNRDLRGLIYATEALLGQDESCLEYCKAYHNGVFGDPPKAK